jgi:hypothetical protein
MQEVVELSSPVIENQQTPDRWRASIRKLNEQLEKKPFTELDMHVNRPKGQNQGFTDHQHYMAVVCSLPRRPLSSLHLQANDLEDVALIAKAVRAFSYLLEHPHLAEAPFLACVDAYLEVLKEVRLDVLTRSYSHKGSFRQCYKPPQRWPKASLRW